MTPAWLVLIKAAVLARRSGAREITVRHLLDAFQIDVEPSQAGGQGPFVPVPKFDITFSAEAAAALTSAGEIEALSVEQLRTALMKFE